MKILITSKLLCVVLAALCLQGCKAIPFKDSKLFAPLKKTVPIYKRGNLAKPEMGWSPDPMDSALKKHIYFAKEASSGGAEAAGGGCGCN